MTNIQLLIADVDGIMTDGSLTYDANGEVLRTFHVLDGHGIKKLAHFQIQFAVISGRNHPATQRRLQELGVEHVFLGVKEKISVYEQLKQSLNLKDENIAYIGDDEPDMPLLERAGLSATVPNAMPFIQDQVDFCCQRQGGQGALREFIEYILKQHASVDHEVKVYAT